jgi:hypothetical protein
LHILLGSFSFGTGNGQHPIRYRVAARMGYPKMAGVFPPERQKAFFYVRSSLSTQGNRSGFLPRGGKREGKAKG